MAHISTRQRLANLAATLPSEFLMIRPIFGGLEYGGRGIEHGNGIESIFNFRNVEVNKEKADLYWFGIEIWEDIITVNGHVGSGLRAKLIIPRELWCFKVDWPTFIDRAHNNHTENPFSVGQHFQVHTKHVIELIEKKEMVISPYTEFFGYSLSRNHPSEGTVFTLRILPTYGVPRTVDPVIIAEYEVCHDTPIQISKSQIAAGLRTDWKERGSIDWVGQRPR